MIKEIATTNAYYGGGLSIQKKLFVVPSGAYQGRAIIVFPTSSSQIVFVWADPPYTLWSSETIVASDSADYPACAHMDDDGNVYVAYTVQSSLDLAEKKLTFSDGVWQAGSKNVVYNADSNYFPSLYKDVFDRLWVSFTRESGGVYYVNVKRSTDDGVTWGTGPSDPGTALTSGADSCYSQLVYRPNHVYCIYTEGGTKLAYRRRNIAAALYDDEVSLYTGTGLGANFSGAASEDLRLGIAFCDSSNVYYKEFDGSLWSGIETIDTSYSVNPNLSFRQNVPYVVFARQIGTDQQLPYFSYREGSEFVSPIPMSVELSTFDKVLCYRPSSAVQFMDKTSAAADDTSADVYHDDSNKLMLSAGDGVYIGQSEPFTTVAVNLSTTGGGGNVSWYYWDGSDWKVFTPASGAYNFDSSPALVRLWEDSDDLPGDWQLSVVSNSAKFWVKAVASSDFSTAPVGSQITGVTNLSYIISG